MADETIFELTGETAMTAASRLIVQKTGATTRATSATYALMGGLEIDAISTQSGNYTGVVGKLTCWTMAGEAANRDFVLPASAQVGERVGIYIVDGDPTDEILIKANDDTDKIGNTASFNTTEFTRLFIENECMIFRCVSAGAPDWIVEYDGRIPCRGFARHDTNYTLGSGTTEISVSGVTWDTLSVDIGNTWDSTNHRFIARRDGFWTFYGYGFMEAGDYPSTSDNTMLSIGNNTTAAYWVNRLYGTGDHYSAVSGCDDFNDGQYLKVSWYSDDTNKATDRTYVGFLEILKG